MSTKRGRDIVELVPKSKKTFKKRPVGDLEELASKYFPRFTVLTVGPKNVTTLFFNNFVSNITPYFVSYYDGRDIRYVGQVPDPDNRLMRGDPVDQVVLSVQSDAKVLGMRDARAIFKTEQVMDAPLPLVILDLGKLDSDKLFQFKTVLAPQLLKKMDMYNVPYMIMFRDNLNSQIIYYMSKLVDSAVVSTNPIKGSQQVRSALVERYQQLSPTCSQFMYALFENLAARGSFMRSPFNIEVRDIAQQSSEDDDDYANRILREQWIKDLNQIEYSEELVYDLVGNIRDYLDEADIPDISYDKDGNVIIETLMDLIVSKIQGRADASMVTSNFKSLETFFNESLDAAESQNILYACIDNDPLVKSFQSEMRFSTIENQTQCTVFKDLSDSVELGACKYYVVKTIKKVDRLTNFIKGPSDHAVLVMHCTDTDKIYSVGLGYLGEMDLSAVDPQSKVGRNLEKREKAVGFLEQFGSITSFPRNILQNLSLNNIQALYTPDVLLTNKLNLLKSFAFDAKKEKRKYSYLFGKFVEVAHYGDFSKKHLRRLEKFASFISQIVLEYSYDIDVVPIYTVKEKMDVFGKKGQARGSTDFIVNEKNYMDDEVYRTLSRYDSKRPYIEAYGEKMGAVTISNALQQLKREIVSNVNSMLLRTNPKRVLDEINSVLEQHNINNLKREYMLDKTIVVDNHVTLVNVTGFYSEVVTQLSDPSCSADSPGNCSSFIEYILSDEVTCKNMIGISNPSNCRGLSQQKDCSDLRVDQDEKTVDLVRSAISLVGLQ